MNATISWITSDEQSVKAAYKALMIKYANDQAVVLDIMNQNPLALASATTWQAELKQDVEVMQPWKAGETLLIGELRSYNSQRYVVVQTHTTQVGWEPPKVPALFTLKPVPSTGQMYPDWIQPTGAQDAYHNEDIVHHVGEDWQSRRGTNTWVPGSDNSGWMQVSHTPPPWYYLGSEGYPKNWEVTHSGFTWISTVDFNYWEPGIYGWTKK